MPPITAAGRKAISRLRVKATSLGTPVSVPRISCSSRARNTHITARMEPSWITTSNTLPWLDSKLIQSPIRMRWPVLDTGMNSVSPSTMPRKKALIRYRVFSVTVWAGPGLVVGQGRFIGPRLLGFFSTRTRAMRRPSISSTSKRK